MTAYTKHYASLLEKQIKIINEKLGKEFSIKDFEELNEIIIDINRDLENDKTYISRDIALTKIGIDSIAMVSLLFSEDINILNEEWLRKDKMKIIMTFSGLITQLANGFLGIVKLIDAGLDYQARVLFRNVTELSWLIIVLISDMEWLEKYIQGERNAKMFEPYKVRGKLTEIEGETKLPKPIRKAIMRYRRETSEFYSEIIHNAFPNPILGTLVSDFSNGKLYNNLFGKISISSQGTLSAVNKCLFLFLLMFYKALVDAHGFTAIEKDEEVRDFIALTVILKETYIEGFLLTRDV